ncbi:metallophosphoesterase [Candidatus Bipolaricaulota bacterium]|jgi:2',3'-cyclic-nucleotide 2'-phosphodiesterase (5'-nucleotidase family)|nr:metallophosphoesterase [Candidatus Bipolaricaulota bacterium]
MIRRVFLTILFALLAEVMAIAVPITVLYTNDLHVRLDRFDSLAAIIATERESESAVLLFDAGDTWQDHRRLVTNVWGSSETVDWMNDVAYSAMSLGNHDTYWGPKRLAALVSDVQFPVLCANWRPIDGSQSDVSASTIVHMGDVSLLIVGLITAEFVPVPAYPRLRYRDPVVCLREQIDLHDGAFDFVFVVAHVSIAAARIIVQQVPEVALFVSGHSHEHTPEPIRQGTTLIVQSGAFAQSLGRLRLDVNTELGELAVLSNDLVSIERTPVDVRAGVHKLVTVLAAIALATALWIL